MYLLSGVHRLTEPKNPFEFPFEASEYGCLPDEILYSIIDPNPSYESLLVGSLDTGSFSKKTLYREQRIKRVATK